MKTIEKVNEQLYKYTKLLNWIVFPLLLFLFPLLKINQGIELWDNGYSLANYRFFDSMDGTWTLATYLANVTGYLLMKLPFGATMLGMRFYTALFVSAMALFGYRFFMTKMPAWLAFAAEMMAIGLCWCPTVILYNYMTYFFFLLGGVILFRGLAGARPFCLVLAGVCLGMNVSVRFPNVLEAGLILALWYYGWIKKKTFMTILKETGLCLAGYVLALVAMFAVISFNYGLDAYTSMISGIFNMAGSASDYTLAEMLFMIVDAYLHGFRWLIYIVMCVLPGIPFIMIRKELYPRLRKVVYCLCIAFLFFVLGRWGMFNYRYYQKEAALQWVVIFLLLSIGLCIWVLCTRREDKEWKLIAAIGLLVILITPLGSNNHVYPIMNNMFFVAPITFWFTYKFVRWGRQSVGSNSTQVPLFPVKAMQAAVVIAVLVQSLGIGCFYVFRDGETGEKRDTQVIGNEVLAGMYTNGANAEQLEELTGFFKEFYVQYENKSIITYGNIPGVCYYMQKPSALSTSWPDLATNGVSQFTQDLKNVEMQIDSDGVRPLLVVTPSIAAYVSEDAEGMAWFGTDVEACDKDEKLQLLKLFMEKYEYKEVFSNTGYVVLE